MGIENYLKYGENVIFEGKAPEIMIDGGSSFGVYTLVITDRKRIIVHDTGGFFGDEKVYYFSSNRMINVQLYEDSIHLLGNTQRYNFNFKLDLWTFFDIYKGLGEERFQLVNNQCQHCFLFTDKNTLMLAEFLIKDQEIIFKLKNKDYKNKSFSLDFSEIQQMTEDSNGVLKLKVNQNILESDSDSLFLYVYDTSNRKKIISSLNNRISIYDFARPDERITAAALEAQLDREKKIEYDVYILDNETTIRIVLRKNLKVLLTKQKTDFDEYYDKESKQIILKIGESYFFVSSKYIEGVQFKDQNSSQYLYIENTGSLAGFVQENKLSEGRVDIAISSRGISLIDFEYKLPILTLTMEDNQFYLDGNLLFISGQGSLVCVDINRNKQFITSNIDMKEIQEENILLDSNKELYFFYQNNEGLVLYRNDKNKPEYIYPNHILAELKLTPERYGQSFGLVEFTDERSTEKTKFYYPVHSLNQLIYNSFIASKSQMVVQADPKALFSTMVRQISDLTLYEYFGQLIALYEGIEDFEKSNMTDKERASKLVSYLYYGIQSQRKRMDSVSVFMPGMLNKVECELFNSLGEGTNEKYFKELQQKLIAISNQMKSSLHEMENNLTHLGVLVPNRSMREVISERRKSGYKTVGLGTALGAGVSILTGGASALLLAPVFMALNTKNTTKIMELQEEIKEENEQKRMEFYLLKVLDLLDHFIHTMLPYFVSKVNDAIFECYKKQSQKYAPLLDEQLVKDKMFQRVAEIHTYKKMPVEPTVEINKGQLLASIFETTEAANQSISSYEELLKLSGQSSVLSK
jgi:hypothetical protein